MLTEEQRQKIQDRINGVHREQKVLWDSTRQGTYTYDRIVKRAVDKARKKAAKARKRAGF